MRASHIILAGIAGTTAFTLFSYIVSKTHKKNFREPELLGDMVDTSIPETTTKAAKSTGWILHYLVGLGFSTSYAFIIRYAGVKPNITNGLISGASSGLIAIAWWNTALNMHPEPPRQPDRNYFGHLFLGHVIFGATAFTVFRTVGSHNAKRREIENDPLGFSFKLSRYATSGS